MRRIFTVILLGLTVGLPPRGAHAGRIDRRALVRRHSITVVKPDPLSPLTVGNGEFAFTADVTGLQTFPGDYADGIPLSTMSQWGWHSFPNPQGYRLDQTLTMHEAGGRWVGYASEQNGPAGQWLRSNPHRLHLGRIGFRLELDDGSEARLSDLADVRQTADLWEGVLRSSFSIGGRKIEVETACHPEIDQVAVRIRSGLLKTGRIAVRFDFPYGSASWGGDGADWSRPDLHRSEVLDRTDRSARIRRTLDADTYFVSIRWNGRAVFDRTGAHSFALSAPGAERLELACRFSGKDCGSPQPDANGTFKASVAHWERFWRTGGAVDLSGSRDPRAGELERRIILSRYLTAVQCAGSMPPQETGLTCNSWFGKFHLEMHWWHAVHFVLWGHPELLERSLGWYLAVLPEARRTAAAQGYDGARWPKMTSPDGRDSPSSIGVFLAWQQPHPIYYAELLYRTTRDSRILRRYESLVFETAGFMASFARSGETGGPFRLGPPLIPAQEIHNPDSTWNPGFELAYWAFGLATAQRWRERLGLGRLAEWDSVLAGLPPLPAAGGTYQNAETALNTFNDVSQRNDHPTLLAPFGMLSDASVDTAMMGRTLDGVLRSWNWESAWGWDFPLAAMTAARLGRPGEAVDALLMEAPKNTYLPNGHNRQNARLPLYLPGNGGLLAAVAMMAGGWDGCPKTPAPGFPKDGNWTVHWEGLHPMP
jgi:protein-glucosylgalactosylhydroxylysine glucosidase